MQMISDGLWGKIKKNDQTVSVYRFAFLILFRPNNINFPNSGIKILGIRTILSNSRILRVLLRIGKATLYVWGVTWNYVYRPLNHRVVINNTKYRVTYKGWDFGDDCTEFLLSVFLYTRFPAPVNLYVSLPNY